MIESLRVNTGAEVMPPPRVAVVAPARQSRPVGFVCFLGLSLVIGGAATGYAWRSTRFVHRYRTRRRSTSMPHWSSPPIAVTMTVGTERLNEARLSTTSSTI